MMAETETPSEYLIRRWEAICEFEEAVSTQSQMTAKSVIYYIRLADGEGPPNPSVSRATVQHVVNQMRPYYDRLRSQLDGSDTYLTQGL